MSKDTQWDGQPVHDARGLRKIRARHAEVGNPGADLYPTPPGGTKALLSVEKFEGLIWEPACGNGAISQILIDAGHEVLSTDLNDWSYGLSGQDFLVSTSAPVANIVTNPPYNISRPFIYHALSLFEKKLCLLLPLANLARATLRDAFSHPSFARVWIFSPRLAPGTFDKTGRASTGVFDVAWMVWDQAKTSGNPTIDWLRPPQHRKQTTGFFPLS